jgi:hypothetical protein
VCARLQWRWRRPRLTVYLFVCLPSPLASNRIAQFGDLTKGAIKSWEEMCADTRVPPPPCAKTCPQLTTEVDSHSRSDSVRDATGNEDYKVRLLFLSLTNRHSSVPHSLPSAPNSRPMLESRLRQFGDVTKNAMKGLFGMMEKGAAVAKQKIEDADK